MAIDTKTFRARAERWKGAKASMPISPEELLALCDALDEQTAELEALWAKVERWQKEAALPHDNPSYSPATRALLAARRTPQKGRMTKEQALAEAQKLRPKDAEWVSVAEPGHGLAKEFSVWLNAPWGDTAILLGRGDSWESMLADARNRLAHPKEPPR